MAPAVQQNGCHPNKKTPAAAGVFCRYTGFSKALSSEKGQKPEYSGICMAYSAEIPGPYAVLFSPGDETAAQKPTVFGI